ncbi:MAG: hypothetical protein ACW976_00235 [Candidatus Ranarchaeia archaeon]|jgi:hypothetical protein
MKDAILTPQEPNSLSDDAMSRLADLMRILRILRPNPPLDIACIASLFLEGAISKSAAKKLAEHPIVEELEMRNMLTQTTKQHFYLTEDAILLAKGALKVYPELVIPPVA